MTSYLRSPSSTAAYTLLEILLALGLCAILAVVSVPAMGGWWSEYQLRAKADHLVKLVQSVKLEAERSGQPAVVVLLKPGEQEPAARYPNTRYFREDEHSLWSFKGFGNNPAKEYSEIRIDGRGYVEPMAFRVAEGSRFIEYRFDFLTGHAREEESSF